MTKRFTHQIESGLDDGSSPRFVESRRIARLFNWPGKGKKMKQPRFRRPGTLGICMLVVLAGALFGCGSPAASDPDNFRGVKWGTEVSSVSALSQIASDGELIFYEKGNDRLQLEEVRLDQVVYGFYKGRFYMGMIYFQAAGFSRVQEIMTRQFGQPAKPDNTPSKLLWDGADVSVLLASGDSDVARIVYVYKPIQLEVELKK